ncbi:MAG: SGNH/GDSL hydrolase family protein [Woeseia sp.]|nr:SGNH/GDSL hydrolase family protein [Woeseia sp.]
MKTSVLLFLFAFFFSPELHSQEFTHIVAFGDSFTDNGYIDGHGFSRDSNGKVWVEHLKDKLQAEKLDNRAWGGARTDHGHFLGFDWSGFNWQVDRFEMKSKPGETLFTVWIGVNDYWDAKDDPAISVENIKRGLDKLIEKGARHLVVFNNFDLTLSLGYGPKTEYHDLVPAVKELTKNFNVGLHQMLFGASDGFAQEYPQVTLYFVDIDTFMAKYVKKHEFTDTPWQGSYAFPDPEKYLWYDEWHPMTQCHLDIAALVHRILQE